MSKKTKQPRNNTTQTSRLLRLTGMTTSIATKMATQRMRQLFQSEEQSEQAKQELIAHIGEQVAVTLGEMKGAVMKVGQIASQMSDVLPQSVADALTVLQKASPPMPFPVIQKQIRRQLGDNPDQLFKHFDEVPFAAASIGQVHRATTHDGIDVVVKVQYPAVKESIDSDMRHLRRILKLGGLLKVSTEVLDALFREIKQQLQEELNYIQEAANLTEFRAFHAHQPWIVIPEVIKELSDDKVLTLSYEAGDDLSSLVDNPAYDQALRNQLGERLFDAIGEQIFRLHAVHADPHPGNFAFRTDGSLVIYDFGAVKRLKRGDLLIIRRLFEAAIEANYSQVDQELIHLAIRKPDGPPVEDHFYQGWIDLLLPPFSDTPFNFAESDLHIKVVKKARKTPWAYLKSFQPSPKVLMLNRVLEGHYWTLMKLGVNKAFSSNLKRTLAMLD